MRLTTARLLSRLTSEFYARTHASFSATREAPWPGWDEVLRLAGVRERRQLRVLDLACGNLRFERFLARELADGVDVRVFAFDGCDELALGGEAPGLAVGYTHLDVADALMDGGLRGRLDVRGCDLAVCFGFMHHVPLVVQRADVLASLVDAVAPGGCVAVSFWQLSHSERLLAKARATTEAALPGLGIDDLEMGDYLLGWQGRTDVLRYCHDFSEREIDELVARVSGKACEAARFSADGATGNLNRYLVLRRIGG